MSFQILSIDGGGMRGIIPAIILAELERRASKPCSKLFDLIAGTSTGGILACCAGIGAPMSSVVSFYREDGPTIFHRNWLARLFDPKPLNWPKYGARGIEGALAANLADHTLADTMVDIMVMARDTRANADLFFKSSKARKDPAFNFLLAYVARCTSAAPTYFPSVRGIVDGGVFANHPADNAIIEALDAGHPLSDIRVLSLGTGQPKAQPLHPSNEGIVGLAPHIDALFFRPGEDAVDHRCRSLIGDHYIRIQPCLGDVRATMDDASPAHLDALAGIAQQAIRDNAALLNAWAQKP